MDKKDQIFQFSNYRRTLNNQLNELKDKLYTDLEIFYEGGSFTVSMELITFVQMITTKGYNRIVLLDKSLRPVEVNPEEFLDHILDVYFQATNSYFNEHNRVSQARDVQGILDLDE